MKFSYSDIGKGKTIIFFHSYLWDKEMRQPQLEFFKDNFKCIVKFLSVIYGRDISLELLKYIQIPTYFFTGEFDIPRPIHEAELMSKLFI